MKVFQFKSISLLWRILLSTSIAATALFGITGWMVQSYVGRVSEHSLEEEVRTSLQAYKALWGTRAHTLESVSRIISSMSDVRAAFMTGDRATIRDTAAQLWSQISEEDAVFLVLDPTGGVIASLGGDYPDLALPASFMRSAFMRFPDQASGYVCRGRHLYYLVLTPVYVQAGNGQALLNVLLVAFDISDKLAYGLKTSTHGSEFAFACGNKLVASSLPLAEARDFNSGRDLRGDLRRTVLHGTDYLVLGTQLKDIDDKPVGGLYIIRPFIAPGHALAELQHNVELIWLLAIALSLALTYLLARRILEPVKRLDRAAEEVTAGNYDYRVPVEREDELGRLARTFNEMCDSIRKAQEELIRHERMSTIARLSTSIVHDLRNPLAAIYGGAEMLVDTDLTPEQSLRLAMNIYRASRRIQELLQDLSDISRGEAKPMELCRLGEIVNAACDSIARTACSQSVSITVDVPGEIELPAERGRVERVFTNLLNNGLEAMPNGGSLTISARQELSTVLIRVQDTGPGLSEEAWATLFQPFASFGKKNGLGLGLALSRQTILDHGGDLWAEKTATHGACFAIRVPLVKTTDTATSETRSYR